jgi:hypothetical protein
MCTSARGGFMFMWSPTRIFSVESSRFRHFRTGLGNKVRMISIALFRSRPLHGPHLHEIAHLTGEKIRKGHKENIFTQPKLHSICG